MNSTPEPDSRPPKPIKKSSFPHQLFFESFGVNIRVSSNEIVAIDTIKERLPEWLPGCFRLIPPVKAAHEFGYIWNRSERDSLYKDQEKILVRFVRESLIDLLGAKIRLTVAEFAVERVFVHAGVVSWRGKAIVMPGKSFQGKSSLTAELVRRGALYYSDEYAIFDKGGLVSPFPKMLSLRGKTEGDKYIQTDYRVEEFGGKSGTETIPVGMVLLTKYKAKAKWKPRVLSTGNGLIEIIRDTIPIRNNPAFTFTVLNQVAKNSLIVKSPRGDAAASAKLILNFFEERCL
ncbi:MAG: hypothetical protein ABIO36_10850 [Pyrinomonadaceae bacterium]